MEQPQALAKMAAAEQREIEFALVAKPALPRF